MAIWGNECSKFLNYLACEYFSFLSRRVDLDNIDCRLAIFSVLELLCTAAFLYGTRCVTNRKKGPKNVTVCLETHIT